MRTLILGALKEEIEGLKAELANAETHTAGAFEVYAGQIGGKEILICECGVGKVNAAARTAAILTKYQGQISHVINIGVAGGIGEGVKRGDVVIGIRTAQHDFDTTAGGADTNARKGLIDGFDSEFFDGDEWLISSLERALTEENITYHKGIIASGDQFIADSAAAKRIREEFCAISCEMESAAIAHVCKLFGLPFLALRAISDNGDEAAIGSFYEFLHKAAANNVRAVKRFLTY